MGVFTRLAAGTACGAVGAWLALNPQPVLVDAWQWCIVAWQTHGSTPNLVVAGITALALALAWSYTDDVCYRVAHTCVLT